MHSASFYYPMKLPDFNELLALYEANPQALEQLRKTLVNDLIDRAAPNTQARLRGLQFQIDAQRQLSSNPLGACVRMSKMMNQSFSQLVQKLNRPLAASTSPSAKVLPFRRSDSHEVL